MRGVVWRAKSETSDQISTTYKGHELTVYCARRFTWGAIIDGGVWEENDLPVNWQSEAGAMIGAMDIADKMDRNKTRHGRVISLAGSKP
jgi:hypothetical protein